MITVLGSINIDLIAKTRRLPRPGESVSGLTFSTAAGGKGANQALAARRAGAEVRMVGAVGKDSFADASLRFLSDAEVELSNIIRLEGPTGVAVISVGEDGENSIIVIPGANGELTKAEAEAAIASMQSGDILMLQLELPSEVVEQALIAARSKGVTTILNIAPLDQPGSNLSRLADIVVANETEFQLLVGETVVRAGDYEEILWRMHQRSEQTFIVTLGGDGAIAIDNGKIYRVRGLTISPVDTVGAGDTFCGFLAAGLAANVPFPQALRRAAVAGSLACLKSGAQTGIPTWSEVQRYV
ncbi:ribokinase [Rhizobium leguminosarum]|uniref:ribokinase n=1 Tax=Rhizobium leguminosarum TaxID=384 RepID=UPI001F461A75|nr:ribokinase [Rhizobium leguminosarum]UIJ83217.1 ribokinase [Rhizobium leguminosarum]